VRTLINGTAAMVAAALGCDERETSMREHLVMQRDLMDAGRGG
jgi:hypothetical protein